MATVKSYETVKTNQTIHRKVKMQNKTLATD